MPDFTGDGRGSVPSAFWRRCGPWGGGPVSTRRRRRRCSARPHPPGRVDKLSIRARPTAWRSSTPTGSPVTTARRTTCTPVNGILFNHESPRRGETFVTRKITRAVARIKLGRQDYLYLGNLDAVRDWGFANEYAEGMWRMLQCDEPSTFVLGTGVGTTVRQFCDMAFAHAGLEWEQHVRHDVSYERPTEVDALIADPTKARDVLGWKAETSAEQLAHLMVDADLASIAATESTGH